MKTLYSLAILLFSFLTMTAQDTAHYRSPATPIAKGKAPGMTYKLLSENKGIKEYAIVFAKGDEVISGLSDFAVRENVKSARFSAIGALKQTTAAWFDLSRKSYKLIHINQQVELISLIGDIAQEDGKPSVHAHYIVGFPDGKVEGGHLIEAIVMPTVELFITVFPTTLQKVLDQETQVMLIQPEIK